MLASHCFDLNHTLDYLVLGRVRLSHHHLVTRKMFFDTILPRPPSFSRRYSITPNLPNCLLSVPSIQRKYLLIYLLPKQLGSDLNCCRNIVVAVISAAASHRNGSVTQNHINRLQHNCSKVVTNCIMVATGCIEAAIGSFSSCKSTKVSCHNSRNVCLDNHSIRNHNCNRDVQHRLLKSQFKTLLLVYTKKREKRDLFFSWGRSMNFHSHDFHC